MSYHASWEWTQDQFRGFKDGLGDLEVEYKIYELDTKRRSTKEWKEKVGREARALIESWKPDLVYTSDDNAQELVTKYFLNREIPFVFSAVNADPEAYGFTGARNVTGVLEHEHFVETVNLLRSIAPRVRRIAVIVDDDPTWDGVVKRMKAKVGRVPGVEFVAWNVIHTFAEYKRKILAYQDQVDALALLGIHTFKDEDGKNVPWQTVLRWTAENSRLPDFSFWKDRIEYGTLCAVYVSGYEQGLAAGKIARGILAEGRSPADYPIRPTIKGRPRISLARAKRLGLQVKSSLLLSAEVINEFAWEKK
ncbi:MAG: ABC transporter substrate-binding protein [Bacillota bacterium]